MAGMAKVLLIGNVGRDPEQRYTQQGTMMVSFSLAVNQRRRNPDGSYSDETEWYRITTTGRLAEVAQQYVTKGSPLFIEGRLRADRWTGQDGQPRFNLDVFASDLQLLGSRPREGTEGDQPVPIRGRQQSDLDQSDLEDLPF